MRLNNQGDDSANGRATRNAKNIRIRQRISQQRLKTGARNGKRCPNKNSKQNARQPDIENDELIFAGELAGLAKKDAEQIVAQAVERHGYSAELERYHHDEEENGRKNRAVREQAAERQRAQAQTSK